MSVRAISSAPPENTQEEARLELAMKDLNMLVLVGGQERTAKEYEALLTDAGFKDMKVLSSHPGFSVIEALPAQ